MASETYSVKVHSVNAKTIKLYLQITHPDEYYFYEKKNFGLQILWDGAGAKSKLKQQITEDQILDSDWLIAHQDEFIDKVKICSTTNYPDKQTLTGLNRKDFDEFRKQHGVPEALYEIEVKAEAFTAGFKENQNWQSASYDMEDDL